MGLCMEFPRAKRKPRSLRAPQSLLIGRERWSTEDAPRHTDARFRTVKSGSMQARDRAPKVGTLSSMSANGSPHVNVLDVSGPYSGEAVRGTCTAEVSANGSLTGNPSSCGEDGPAMLPGCRGSGLGDVPLIESRRLMRGV